MFVIDQILQGVDYLNEESNPEVDKFIDKTYFYALRISCLYPYLSRNYLIFTVLQLSTYVIVVLYHIRYLILNAIFFLDIDLVLFCQSVHFLMLCFVALVLLVTNAFCRRDLARIHKYMATDFYDYGEDHEDVKKSYKNDVYKEKLRLSAVPVAASLNGLSCMFLSRLLDQAFGSFDESKYKINFLLPFPGEVSDSFDSTKGMPYLITLGGQMFCLTIILPMVITGAGFILVTVLLDFISQLRFLLYTIENNESRAVDLYMKKFGTKPMGKEHQLYEDKRFQKCYKTCISKCVDHYSTLLSVFENIQSFMGINFIQCYVVGSVIIALSANCVKFGTTLPGTTFAAFALCLNEVAFMYLLSTFGQRISDLSDKVRLKFYGLKWYHCDRDFKKGLQISLEATSRTITIMGGKIVPVNLNTFSNVMNSAYTYYNLLTAFSADDGL